MPFGFNTSRVINILSIDLEDYFMVSAFDSVVKREDWDRYESRIERNTYRLLDILNGSLRTPNSEPRPAVRATFFCLGWIAERYPGLIKRIKEEKHEIASHGYAHKLIYHQSRGEFKEDIRKAKSILEGIVGEEVIGYRAPTYSITQKSRWALEILIEEGFKYDSSIFPIRHDFYGYPTAPRFPFVISMNGNNEFEFSPLNFDPRITPNSEPRTPNLGAVAFAEALSGDANPKSEIRKPKSILEFPISTVRFLSQNIPISGGGYFRIFPYPLIAEGLRRINKEEGQPFIFYIHPWEIDDGQPRVQSAQLRSKIRHYINLAKTQKRLTKLLNEFRFSSIKETVCYRELSKNYSMPKASYDY